MAGLLIAGTVVFCAGVLTVVWGVPIKDFSFGNTLILVGVTVACTGLLMIGLSFVVRELKNIGRRLEAGALRGEGRADAGVLTPRVDLPSPSSSPAPELPKVARPVPPRPAPTPSGGFLFPRDEPRNRQAASEEQPSASEDESRGEPSSPPWRDEGLTRRASSLFPKAEEAAAETPAERPRRNFLFASRRRAARGEEAQDTAPAAEELPDLDSAREATDRAESSRRFQDSWSSENSRADAEDNGRPNGGGRFPPFRRSEEPAVTVVKSGVVDAMEYKLYSDGSIEAQMPEGMVRFESIDALRAHLGQND
jgi:hypothetical protein